ncbi:hypothetical protein QJS10_CPA08g01140 [Acorus calamus]|uniref:Uncharacterized protein n=1 Tax=Acorus calamus TaxID=4465 RepID=A0AAV9E8X1_ACOCL|nr:hypothetical protein QJS10_CPA08g01140 [Acorus calamus]
MVVPSAFRVLVAVAALNRALSIHLGLNEVRSFYIQKPLTGGCPLFYLSRRPASGTLILDANEFIYDWRSKVLHVRGPWFPEDCPFRIPTRMRGPYLGLGASSLNACPPPGVLRSEDVERALAFEGRSWKTLLGAASSSSVARPLPVAPRPPVCRPSNRPPPAASSSGGVSGSSSNPGEALRRSSRRPKFAVRSSVPYDRPIVIAEDEDSDEETFPGGGYSRTPPPAPSSVQRNRYVYCVSPTRVEAMGKYSMPPALSRKASLVACGYVGAACREVERLKRLIEEEESERFKDFCAGFSTGYSARQDGQAFPSESKLKEMYHLSLFERKCGPFAEEDPETSTRPTPSTSRPGRQE